MIDFKLRRKRRSANWKEITRQELNKATGDYLAEGGKITILEAKGSELNMTKRTCEIDAHDFLMS